MLNQVILVWRLTHDIVLEKCKDKDKFQEGKNYAVISLAIPRSFKNAEGVYETDFINCALWGNVAESTAEYCKKGDIVGIKGRLQSDSFEREDGNKEYRTQVMAEKVTFLSANKEKENERD